MCIRLVVFVLLTALTAGCSLQTPPDVSTKLDEAHRAILDRDSKYFRANFIPGEYSDEEFSKNLANVWKFLPDGAFISRKLAEKQWSKDISISDGTVTTYSYSYQYEFKDGFAAIFIGLVQRTDGLYFNRLRVVRLDGDLIAHHAFTLAGKPAGNYVFLALTILAAVLSLGAFIRIIAMRKRLRRPIRWSIFVLVGFYLFTLDWTTGQISPQSLYTSNEERTEISFPRIGLFSAGIERAGLFSPWILQIYIPLGALLFWLQAGRGRLAMRPLPQKPDDESESTESDES